MFAHKTSTVFHAVTVGTSLNRSLDILDETLHTKRLVGTCFVIHERHPELVLVSLEAQLLPKVSVLVFEY
jgi:hypothetical protein